MSLFPIYENFELVLPEESVIIMLNENYTTFNLMFIINNSIIYNDTTQIEFEPNDEYEEGNENDKDNFIHPNDLIYDTYNNKNANKINDMCYICFDDFINEQNILTLQKCKHSFCVDCITTWFKTRSKSYCPICRMSVS
ncbi:ring finger protein [Erannis ankeraria nucleopolyhedrovirus]|uniref:ring finger protein n=1 Tax=Erannis ankeraria nucleopolyhedrovirus TaxID=2913600 RepID=UPI0011798F93|nr:ring finger protein [Erannis ankeraria nucleopolyhedrovirus]UJZ89016.1 ring finger protein [Erannis ankeraria nucleopolyhedrovirus]